MMIAITVCVVLVAGLLGSISIIKSKEAIEKEAENNLINLVSSQAKDIELLIDHAEMLGENFVKIASDRIDVAKVANDQEAMDAYELEIAPSIESLVSISEHGTGWVVYNSDVIQGANTISYIRDNNGEMVREGEYDANTFDKEGNEWWYVSLEKGQLWTVPYIWKNPTTGTETKYISYGKRIEKDGKIIGVAGTDLKFNDFSEILSDIKIYKNGYMVLMNGNFDVLYHPKPEMENNNMETVGDGIMADAVSQIKNSSETTGIIHYKLDGDKKIGAFYKLSNGWIAMACPYVEEMFATQRSLSWILLVVTAGGILISIMIATILGRSISKPIVRFVKDVEVVATGDLSVDMKITSKDEVGLLQKSFISMIDSMKMQVQSAQKIAAGEKTIIDVRSEKDALALGLQGILENNEKLSVEIENLSKSAAAGDLSIRADENAFEGKWKDLVSGLNELVEKVALPLGDAGEYIKLMAEGEHYEAYDTSKYEGEFRVLMENILEVRASISTMVQATSDAAQEAVKGNLSYRADLTKLKGQYETVVKGMNDTLDAVIEPINEASAVLADMAEGKLDARVTGDYKGDHAQIKTGLNSMGENIQGYIGEISSTLESMSNKSLDVYIARDYVGDFAQLKDSINHIINQFNVILEEINEVAEQVEFGASQVAASSQTLAQGASEQASSLEEISASMTQVSEQTKGNAVNANKAYEFVQGGSDGAKEGNQRMNDMLEAMNDIKESSKNIGGVIKVIDDIAFQTNILALNAAVEAARAGEHGKGFAVVAEEVRNLAARSAEAAKETTALIDDSINKVDEGYQLANETAVTLKDIEQGSKGAVKINNEIANASQQQSNAIEEMMKGIEQISQVTQTNTATTEESASASEEMAGKAQTLKAMISEFSLKGNQSLETSDKEGDMSLGLLPQGSKDELTLVID